jgi:glycosyltransferase involved in cell wall biosynthesis
MVKPKSTLKLKPVSFAVPRAGFNNFPDVPSSSLPEILFITSFPPRECGIATYTQDLIKALNNKFKTSFKISICALETESEEHVYTDEIKYIFNTDKKDAFEVLANDISNDSGIKIIMIQHEFGFFENKEKELNFFLQSVNKPVSVVFHTVLPDPDSVLKIKVQEIADLVHSIVVMTNTSARILIQDYGISKEKITVIAHGTHLVKHGDKEILKAAYQLKNKKVLSTFGLLGAGKSIETTLNALPVIVKKNPDTIFLIIGKTHPSVLKKEGEVYRNFLADKIELLKMTPYVRFINAFLPLPVLLDYLQLTDIYLFTSKDPNQAVSGTFSYAISCGCPIISTPIPHAREVIKKDAGIIIDIGNSEQLSTAVNALLEDDVRRTEIGLNGLHQMASTAWENSAIAHALLLRKLTGNVFSLLYDMPEINLSHIKKLTTNFGMVQFSKINIPDISSGYTLDDNARALIAMCMHYTSTGNNDDILLIQKYLDFIKYCLQPDGKFLNYVDIDFHFTTQNQETNLNDSNGRAIWALGFLVSKYASLPESLVECAISVLKKAVINVQNIHSTRAMAFIIKGLYYANKKSILPLHISLIRELADRMVQMYRHESSPDWHWFESYMTYGNSILPEALLYAWMATGNPVYKDIAETSFDFLLKKTFHGERLIVISNKTWLYRDGEQAIKVDGGEQPIDVAYTIIALKSFYEVTHHRNYLDKMQIAFNWFMGANHLHQIIYNPCTGGCYDGLEEHNVNLNQGAESTVSYLMARMTLDEVIMPV